MPATSAGMTVQSQSSLVMAGLVPAIHVLLSCKDVDARNKCGHDDREHCKTWPVVSRHGRDEPGHDDREHGFAVFTSDHALRARAWSRQAINL